MALENNKENQALTVEESCRALDEYLRGILAGTRRDPLDVEGLSQPCRALGETLRSLQTMAQGLLDGAGQASGLEELCEAYRSMTRQLREREEQLKREARRARRRAEIIDSYTEMLVDLLGQREEWLVVVDQETQEIVHCNKRTRDGGGESGYCAKCRHRLPIQPKLLELSGPDRYQIWEQEEQDCCYRVISFPIEWKERPSGVHIVMDITTEKMNARHLSDESYQDVETGIRNHLFLEEFLGQVLRERLDITLCYLDLEGVSAINETQGRKAGDAYIQDFVDTVRKSFRSSDTFARLREDKFCLVLSGNVRHLIERKMDEIITAFQTDARTSRNRCSFRFSVHEVDGETNTLSLEELFQEAENEVRRKKRKEQRKQRKPSFDDW